MSRSRPRPRTSRVLLIVLALTVAVGVFTFANQYRKNKALAAATPGGGSPGGSAAGAAAPVRSGGGDDDDGAVVTQTPTSGKAATTTRATAGTRPSTQSASATAGAAAAATSRPAGPVSPAVILSSKPLADAKAKADADKPLEARDIYNAALLSGKLSPEETGAAKQQLAALNETIVFSPRRLDADPLGGSFAVPPGGVMAKIAKRFDVTPELLCRINKIPDPKRLQAGQTIKIVRGPMHAVVDKSDFTLDVYFGAPGGPGSSYVTTLPVGLGKDDSTPTGKWIVEPLKKLANPTYFSPRGEGVIDKDDPRNPLGEFWIGLTGVDGQAVGKLSYGIHGTIEPESIGTMASMGCIRLRHDDIALVYELLVEGKSTVLVVD